MCQGSQNEAQTCIMNKVSATLFESCFILYMLHKDISVIGQTHLQVSTSHFQAHRLPFPLSGRLPISIREALGKLSCLINSLLEPRSSPFATTHSTKSII